MALITDKIRLDYKRAL
ncbi:MAG: hypothetical protein ACLTF6_03725 [Clostridium sp.]